MTINNLVYFPKGSLDTNRPIKDFRNWFPPTRMADTIMVIIPIGAMLSKITSAGPMEVARNCLVTSSPKRVRRGAKLEKALLAKLSASTVGLVLLADILAERQMNGMTLEMSLNRLWKGPA